MVVAEAVSPSMKGGPWKGRDAEHRYADPMPGEPSMKGGPWKGRDKGGVLALPATLLALNEGRPLEGPR